MNSPKLAFRYLSIDDIERDWDHPRRDVGGWEEEDLVRSVGEHGVLTALAVMDQEDGSYLLIDGQRRLYAVKRAGLTTVPCVIYPHMEPAELDLLRYTLQEVRG